MNSLGRILNMIRSDAVNDPIDCEDYGHAPYEGCKDYEQGPRQERFFVEEKREDLLGEIYHLIDTLVEKEEKRE